MIWTNYVRPFQFWLCQSSYINEIQKENDTRYYSLQPENTFIIFAAQKQKPESRIKQRQNQKKHQRKIDAIQYNKW